MNKRLAIIYSKVLACVNACVDNNVAIDTEAIRKEVWKMVDEQSDKPTFLDWVAEQIPALSISEGTRKHYEPLLARLEAFGKIRRWSDVTVENVVAFDAYLHTVRKPLSDAASKSLKNSRTLASTITTSA